MKKFIVAVMMCFAVATAAKAQDTKYAVGLRLGGSAELLFDYNLSSENFLQFTVSFPNYDGVALTGIYNWRCCEWNWTPRTCTWHLNAGVGAALGMYNFDNAGFLVGVAGSCAFGCLFKSVPISIDVDYRPIIGAVAGGGDKGFFTPGFWNFGLAVAYHF